MIFEYDFYIGEIISKRNTRLKNKNEVVRKSDGRTNYFTKERVKKLAGNLRVEEECSSSTGSDGTKERSFTENKEHNSR